MAPHRLPPSARNATLNGRGSELISVLKSKPETANIPIVIVTARSNGFDSKETRAQFTIFKDIDIEEQLEKALASTLEGRAAKGQASAK